MIVSDHNNLFWGTNVPGHRRVWAQSCLGTIVSGHNHVWAQLCLGPVLWAQSCPGTIVVEPYKCLSPTLILTYIVTTYDSNIHVDFFYFTIFKDYVTGLEVLARLLIILYYLFQGRVIVSSHSAFIHYIEVELVQTTKCIIQKNTCFLSLILEIHFI